MKILRVVLSSTESGSEEQASQLPFSLIPKLFSKNILLEPLLKQLYVVHLLNNENTSNVKTQSCIILSLVFLGYLSLVLRKDTMSILLMVNLLSKGSVVHAPLLLYFSVVLI